MPAARVKWDAGTSAPYTNHAKSKYWLFALLANPLTLPETAIQATHSRAGHQVRKSHAGGAPPLLVITSVLKSLVTTASGNHPQIVHSLIYLAFDALKAYWLQEASAYDPAEAGRVETALRSLDARERANLDAQVAGI